jgi:transaldolase
VGTAGRKIKLFADGADLNEIKKFRDRGVIDGFTSNPFFLKKYGVKDYEAFIRQAVEMFPDLSMSFEVLSDDLAAMEREALKIAGWAENCHIKIPITNTQGQSTKDVIKSLSAQGVKLNVTVVFTPAQARVAVQALSPNVSSYISVFAGRIADTGVDPLPIVREALQMIRQGPLPKTELLWASTKELYNIVQAEQAGCSIITVGYDILDRLHVIGRSLEDSSLDMIKMFFEATQASGLSI